MTNPERIPQAEDFMHRDVKTVSPDDTLGDVTNFLVTHGLSNAPVVKVEDSIRILVGFLTEGDCLEHLSNELFHGRTQQPKTAGMIMKRHPICVQMPPELASLEPSYDTGGTRELGDGGLGVYLQGSVDVSTDTLVDIMQVLQNKGILPPPP